MEHIKTYSEMSLLQTFDDRFNYLNLKGKVGLDTFGYDRYMNQMFYKSREWQKVRSYVIVRDNGCDLGIPDRPIMGNIYIHHIEPITIEDIKRGSSKLLDPDNLICVSFETHNALHYGTEVYLEKYKIHDRHANDTCPWLEEGNKNDK